jgi:trehalose 6-phosphate phosphatase
MTSARSVPDHAPPPIEPSWAFFFDVDGTLLEIAARPEDVRRGAGLIAMLARLQQMAPVALISGRPLSELDRLFAPLHLPAAAQHGAQRRRADGSIHQMPRVTTALAPARTLLSAWAAAHPAIVFEDKGLSLALHYRRAPELKAEAARVMRSAIGQLGEEFALVAGNMVFEIRPRGCDKGRAIAEFVAEPPFSGGLPVFIGDDATDEDGFVMVNRLHGHSIKVGSGATAARWRLNNVAQAIAWLDRGVQRLHASRQQLGLSSGKGALRS